MKHFLFLHEFYTVCYDKTINLEIQKGDYHAHLIIEDEE